MQLIAQRRVRWEPLLQQKEPDHRFASSGQALGLYRRDLDAAPDNNAVLKAEGDIVLRPLETSSRRRPPSGERIVRINPSAFGEK